MAIKFYKTNDPYGCFSNFSKHAVTIDGVTWRTTEHYFQAQKFIGDPHYHQIASAPSAKIAAELGRDRSIPLRPDWESVKDDVMRNAVREKVKAYPWIKKLLLDTGDEEIIEDSSTYNDTYWGCGRDGNGKNMLGKIWMEIRQEVKETETIL